MPALISHRNADAPIAWARGRHVRAADYLAAARHMASRLPVDRPVVNLCGQRHHFAVVFSAALLRGVPLLLPSARAPQALWQLGKDYPGLLAVIDAPADTGGLPQLTYERGPIPGPDALYQVPEIPTDQLAALIFTSGSTGAPVAHAKHWGKLVQCALGAGQRTRDLLEGDAPCTVTATVPAQHMFGFELTVMMPLVNEGIIDASHPFYPADVADALARVTGPRILVSTPFHLRTLVESGLPLPAASLVYCATAPLGPQLAREVEARLQAPLLEIYGSTESGQLATRRCAHNEVWQTVGQIEVRACGTSAEGEARFAARGGHLEDDTLLSDVLELESPTRFRLLGRHADLVNIAGKRTSLAYLDHQINSIPGVMDAAMYCPQSVDHDTQARILRLTAFVVAPNLDEATLLRGLRERIDPVFLPRPVHFVTALPRNATGKLPRQALEELVRKATAASTDPQPADTTGGAASSSASPREQPTLRWTPAPFVWTSAGIHLAGIAGLFSPFWPWALGTLLADHALLAAAGLWPRSHLLGPNLTHFTPDQPRIALTIDDGPDPEITPRVLDRLDALGVKASFFCIGAQVLRHPAIARDIVHRGHSIGNHTQHHRHHFSIMGPAALHREIALAQDSIAQTTGLQPVWFRAPAGLRNVFLDPVLHQLGLHLASWTRRGFDTRNGQPSDVLHRLTRHLRAGDVLLLHDRHAAVTPSGAPVILEVLPELVRQVRAHGLEPGPLPAPARTSRCVAVPSRQNAEGP